MPFALVLIGLIMIVTGARGTYAQFGTMVAGEFNPPAPQKSFLYFIAGLGGVGAIGYIPALQTFSRLFLGLVLLGIVIADKGFFANFTAALAKGPQTPNPVAADAPFSIPIQIGSNPQAGQSVSPNASTAAINSAIAANQSGLFGDAPSSSGQAKANGLLNYFFGNSTNSGGN